MACAAAANCVGFLMVNDISVRLEVLEKCPNLRLTLFDLYEPLQGSFGC